MRVFITGISGMAGSHLADFILANHPKEEIHGLIRWRSPIDNIKHFPSQIHLHQGDLRDLNSLIHVLDKVRPHRIFHFAAQSDVMSSFTSPNDTLQTNAIGTLNLLDALRNININSRIMICSSSEVYGQVTEEELPIKESQPFRPASPYAVSKCGTDLIAYIYWLNYGMDIVRVRPFTMSGPRRGDVFAESAFAKQIAQVESGLIQNPIHVGNLDSIRTYMDIRDAVEAFWLSLEKCKSGEVYNIGGVEKTSIRIVLEILCSLSTTKIESVISHDLVRPSDVTLQVPDVTKFQKETCWIPKIPISQTLRDLLDYHRRKILI